MTRKRNQSGSHIEDLTDAEVSSAIHYLDLDSSGETVLLATAPPV